MAQATSMIGRIRTSFLRLFIFQNLKLGVQHPLSFAPLVILNIWTTAQIVVIILHADHFALAVSLIGLIFLRDGLELRWILLTLGFKAHISVDLVVELAMVDVQA